jgi:hypothetical protein
MMRGPISVQEESICLLFCFSSPHNEGDSAAAASHMARTSRSAVEMASRNLAAALGPLPARREEMAATATQAHLNTRIELSTATCPQQPYQSCVRSSKTVRVAV